MPKIAVTRRVHQARGHDQGWDENFAPPVGRPITAPLVSNPTANRAGDSGSSGAVLQPAALNEVLAVPKGCSTVSRR
jgi:hypothetical protein